MNIEALREIVRSLYADARFNGGDPDSPSSAATVPLEHLEKLRELAGLSERDVWGEQ